MFIRKLLVPTQISVSRYILRNRLTYSNVEGLIVFEDNQILVINKPCAMLTQGDISMDENLVDILKQYLKIKFCKPGNSFLGLVHRLDRPCSGLLVFAKTSKAAGRLSESFRSFEVKKKYIALVKGATSPESRCIDGITSLQNINKVNINKDYSTSKVSELEYHNIAAAKVSLQTGFLNKSKTSEEEVSLVEIVLKTGRKHQIRCQMGGIGHPILGDYKYGYDGIFSDWKYYLELGNSNPTKLNSSRFSKAR